jgi:inhibitor of KinA
MPTLPDGARIRPASDRSLVVSFGEHITTEGHQQVTKLLRLLATEPIPHVLNLHPSYASLLITFDVLELAPKDLEATLQDCLGRMQDQALPEQRLVEIPVCYGSEFGPDLNDLSGLLSFNPKKIVELHTATPYSVYFLGFVPGFAYLGELPDALATPRLPTPRRSVPPGSVGIAGKQTGVYPLSTPGGWRLIGRTPIPMFHPETGSRLRIGDRVRFVPISEEQYAALEKEQAKV